MTFPLRKIRPEVRELMHHDPALGEFDKAQALLAREHIVRKALRRGMSAESEMSRENLDVEMGR